MTAVTRPAIRPDQCRRTRRVTRAAKPNWPMWFAVVYIGFQVSLLFLGSTPLRVPLRIGAFSVSLVLLAFLRPGRTGRHPALRWVPLVLACLVPGLFMPGQSSMTAALAGATIYVAVLAPLVWGSNYPLTAAGFRKVVVLLWAFNALSAAVGVLQIYFPGMFQAQLSAVVQEKGKDFIGSLTILLADGSRAFRPMGLTDAPGGASAGGLYAVLFGIGLLFTEKSWVMRALAAAGMVVGLFIIYLTQVRVALVMTGFGTAVIASTFARRGDVRRAVSLAAVVAGVALIGTTWAFAVGGEQTIKRWTTLIDEHPADVYANNRGYFLQDAFANQMLEHPLGQGVGRWGMVAYYFGRPDESLWAEIMWAAWIYDGGIPLTAAYCVLIFVALAVAWRLATASAGGTLAVWAAVVLAYDLAAFAATFDAPIFGTQSGIELWFLNACLFNAWTNRPARASAAAHVSTGAAAFAV